MIAFNGYDGFMDPVGWLVAYLTVSDHRRRAAAQCRENTRWRTWSHTVSSSVPCAR